MTGPSVGCFLCGAGRGKSATVLGVCAECLRRVPDRAVPRIRSVHEGQRTREGLPPVPPRSAGGGLCRLCMHRCALAEGERGYCGIRWAEGGRLRGADARRGSLSFYHDPLPTNCVADWVCPGGTGAGFPEFSARPGPERGFFNLAVFYYGCSFDCLFCQNAQHRDLASRPRWVEAGELASQAHERVTCICFFGGDPAPQATHALRVARLALQRSRKRPLRICWETNGSESPPVLRAMLRVSLQTGGILKVDFKAWSPAVHEALCGVGPEPTRRAIQEAAGLARLRPEPPLLAVSTLMVPGYVDEREVEKMAGFLASLDPQIPYALLAFSPQFHMRDLPPTSRVQADRCLEAARTAGLRRVRVGNIHLLR